VRLNIALVCRDEAQSHVQGYPGAKFKKFKTQQEADQWYRSNLPKRPANPQPTTATPPTNTVTSPNVVFTSSRGTEAARVSWNQTAVPVSKPVAQSTSRVLPTPAPKPVQPPRVAAPKNTTVDIVYSDGACKANGTDGAVAGIGVWWGPNDPRYALLLPSTPTTTDFVHL
jgi:hypothetical protein